MNDVTPLPPGRKNRALWAADRVTVFVWRALYRWHFDSPPPLGGRPGPNLLGIYPVAGCSRRFVPNRRESDVSRGSTDTANIPAQGREAVRVPINVLDNIFRIVGETAIAIGQIQEHLNRLERGNKLVRSNDVALQQRRYELENLVSIRGMAARHRSSVAATAGGSSDFDPL